MLDLAADFLHQPIGLPDLIEGALHLRATGLHRTHRRTDALGQAFDALLDLAGRLRRAPGQAAHLVGDHRETTPLITGARRFDRRI